MYSPRLPIFIVTVFLFSLSTFSYFRLQRGKGRYIKYNSYGDHHAAIFNDPACMLGYPYIGKMIFAYRVVSNEQAFFERVKNKNMPQQQSDSSRWSILMARAQAGSESDYRQLLTELANVIHAYLRNRLGEQHFLDDCVQESLLAIHRARHTYDPKRPFRPWLFTIIRHKVIDYLRHKKAYKRVVEHHQQEEEIQNQGAQPNMMESRIDNGSFLNALPAKYREALTLTKLLGFTCAETAKQLGISESAVKVRVHRAINKLRQILEAEN